MAKPIQLLFTGDVQAGGVFKIRLQENSSLLGNNLQTILTGADYRIFNLEGPVTEAALQVNPQIDLRQPPQIIFVLSALGAAVFNLANNHSTDCGTVGVQDTIKAINAQQSQSFGTLEQDALWLEPPETGIVLLAATLDGKDRTQLPVATYRRLKKRVHQLRSCGARHILLNLHGGEEYTFLPMPSRRKLFRRLAKLPSVRAVIGHHAHVTQGWEEVDGTPVFYGLGNFIFDWPAHQRFEATRVGVVLKLEIENTSLKHQCIPVKIDTQTGLVEYAEGNDLLPPKVAGKKYFRHWAVAAAEVAFTRPQDSGVEAECQSKKHFRWISFARRLLRILFNPDQRPLYIAAAVHLVLTKTGIWK